MRRSSRTRRLFPVALLATLVLTLLPFKWLEWLGQVAYLINLPITPLSHGAGWLAETVWPQRLPAAADAASLAQITEEREEWRRRAQWAEERVRELEQELSAIQEFPVEPSEHAVRLVRAAVTGRNATRPGDAVELNRGSRQGVESGAVAVHNGVHLVGRVTTVAGLRSSMVPITSRSSGLLGARISPTGRPHLALHEMPAIQLIPQGDGTLAGDGPQDGGIAVGDRVLLRDDYWPGSAQAMIIGTVESISPKEEQPLRQRIVVRPRYQAHGLSRVMLVVEQAPREAMAAP